MKMPWLLIIQVVLLVVWYTVAPELPAWLVFIPTMMSAVYLAIMTGAFLVAIAASK